MRCALALLFALAASGCSHDSPELRTGLDPSPFMASRDGAIATDSDLATVPVGLPVTLRVTVPGGTSFAWALVVPSGSAAALSSASAAEPMFAPDLAGTYLVTVRVTFPDGSVLDAELRITAATYLGFAACARCHVTVAGTTDGTPHVRTAERNGAAFFGTPGCTECHVLDPLAPPATPVPGGFAATAAAAGFDPAADFTTFDDLVADFPEVADRASVQCESCHGPGSEHDGDPRKIATTLRADLCGDCHDGTVGPNRIEQWGESAHGRTPPASALSDPSCLRCHTAHGFLRDVAGLPPEAAAPGAPGITCAVCHDPHNESNPSGSRLFGRVPLVSGGSYDAGRAATCFQCHESEVADAAAHAAANRPFPCAVQADMLAGRGAVEFGFDFTSSFHGTTVFRLRPFTGNPDDPDFPDACVICHHAPGPAGFEDRLGGHTVRHRFGGEILASSCNRCHAGLATFDRNIAKDLDGDGVARGVQTEVKNVVEIVFRAIRTADGQGGISRPGGALTPVVISPDLSKTTPLLRQAAYNYNFVVTDGSFGVHNTKYAVQVLRRTYEQLTGVPFGTAFPDADQP